MERYTRMISDWITRMQKQYGNAPYGRDWGQALCIKMYGDNPKDWPDSPAYEDTVCAQMWEADGIEPTKEILLDNNVESAR